MFGISLVEFLVIIFACFLFLKPKDFINFVINIAKTIKQIKNYFYSINNEVEKIDFLNNFNDYTVVKKADSINNDYKQNK